ncbi:hypothetical protein BJX61DRAFT_537048 [Aspergillus egyptiacus]|nr:hypothetical protein BJX61DRAFT_537048 [Aspergillus egyptiacus]
MVAPFAISHIVYDDAHEADAFAHWQNRRALSYVSSHSISPATLYQFQEWEDGIEVAHDGLVYPRIIVDGVDCSNGALFMPNTHLMQKVTWSSFDNYLDSIDNGQPAACHIYLSISKGTAIPKSLILRRERDLRFSLQPSHPMTLQAFNMILTEFYATSRSSTPPEEWLEKHPYHEACFGNSEEWMGC